MKPSGKFTCKLWKEVKPIYKELLKHPFIQGLQNGSLDKSAFKYYIAQDMLYLKDDATSFKNLTKKLQNDLHVKFFSDIQKDMIAYEIELEKEFIKAFKIKKAKKKSFVIKKYTSFLLKTSKHKRPFYAMCALLPCFWLYSAVGLKVHKKSKSKNPYKKWIEYYKDEKLLLQVDTFIKIVENEAKKMTKKELKKARKYFLKSSYYELAFFNEAIRKKRINSGTDNFKRHNKFIF